MKTLKVCLTMAASALVAIAFVVPATASASNWTENGKEMGAPELEWLDNGAPLGETAVVSVEGPMKFSGSLGGAECTVSGEAALIPKNAGLAAFEASTASCKLLGGLKSVCTSVSSVTSEALPWEANAAEVGESRAVNISGVEMAYALKGGYFCPKAPITISGTVTAMPDDSASISSLALSGEFSATLGGNVAVSGTLAVNPAGSYGIGLEQRTVELSGSMGWIGGMGGISCSSVNGEMELESGGKGELTSIDWDAAKCVLSGGLKSSCTSVSLTPTGLPWAVSAEGEGASRKVDIPAFAFDVKFTGGPYCPPKWSFSGDMKATPDDPTAIASTDFSGELSGSSFNAIWSGELDWDPAGVYGIQ